MILRIIVVAVAAIVALPALATARPKAKIAVAPLDGDRDGRITDVVVEATTERAKVTAPERTQHAMDKLGIAKLDRTNEKELRKKLEVDAVVHGKIERGGAKTRLALVVAGRGGRETLEVSYASNKELRDELRKRLPKRIKAASEAPEREDSAEPERDVPDKPRKRRRRDDDAPPRHPATEQTIWADAGGVVARRTLDYDAGGMTAPPRVHTGAFGVHVAGEVYPFASESVAGAGGLGLYGDFTRSLGLGIAVPGTSTTASITESSYEIGARYRFAFGTTTLAIGASYWRRYYIASRGNLASPMALDMPDTDYNAIAPGALVRFAASPTIGVFASADVPLVLSAGQITSSSGYGRGTIVGFGLAAGAQFVLGPHYALAVAGDLDQVSISYQAQPGSGAAARGISGSTDRSMGLVVTIGVLY